jgi:hypothetical protein
MVINEEQEEVNMSKGQGKHKKEEATPPTLSDALTKVSSTSNWFQLSKETKAEFEKAKSAEIESKKAGFVLGGSVKQII